MGWDILNWSFSVVRKDLKLLLFPLVSGGAAAAAAVFFVIFRQAGNWSYPWLFLWYVATTFLMIFGNCALAACALAHFAGREASLGYGFQQAAGRAGNILLWSLLSSTVGLVIRGIERHLSGAGKIGVWLFGAAWGVATFFVIPILVVEDRGPFEALRESTRLVRDTWCDQLVARVRLGWRGLLLFAPVLLLAMAGTLQNPIFWAPAVAYGVLVAAFVSAANGVFQAALYRSATSGEPPADWPPEFASILRR